MQKVYSDLTLEHLTVVAGIVTTMNGRTMSTRPKRIRFVDVDDKSHRSGPERLPKRARTKKEARQKKAGDQTCLNRLLRGELAGSLWVKHSSI